MKAHRLVSVLVAVSAGALLTACGSSSASSITLYSGQHVQTTQALVSAFERSTGITVNVRSDDEDTLANQIVVEGSHSPADVIFTENSPALEYLQSKNLLAPVDASTLAHTPIQYNSPQSDWVGVSARVSVLVYNTSLIKASQLPSSVLQMADPRYAGKLAIAPGETDFQPIVTSFLRTYGKAETVAWLEGIKSNAGNHVYPDNETITNEVNRGAVAFGVINQYYWYRFARGDRCVEHALADHLLRPSGSGLCHRCVGCGNTEVELSQVRRAEMSPRSWYRRKVRRSSPTRSASNIRSPPGSRRLSPKHPSINCSRIRSISRNWVTGPLL